MIKAILFHADAFCEKLMTGNEEINYNRIMVSSFFSEANRMMKGFMSFTILLVTFLATIIGVVFFHLYFWENLYNWIGFWFFIAIPLEVIVVMYFRYLCKAYKIKKGYEEHYEKVKQSK